jgi:hypothetical protein
MHRKIIDSIMALFRVDFSGRGELSERQQKVMDTGVFFCSLFTSTSQLAQVAFPVVGVLQLLTKVETDAFQTV